MVTGPMPRKPNATRPKAKMAGASMRGRPSEPCVLVSPSVLKPNAIAIRAMIVRPSQYALKLPATNPDRIFSDAPPSFEDVTTSLTCADLVDVKILTSSGMIAPASVPHVMTDDNCHHNDGLPPRLGMSRYDRM